MEGVPIVAWQQAVIVVLFAFFVAWLAAFFGKQSDKWQKFMFDIDERWRSFNREQREDNNCAMADVNSSLSNLTKTTSDLAHSVAELRKDIEQHDVQAKEILALVASTVPKTRKKVSTDADQQTNG